MTPIRLAFAPITDWPKGSPASIRKVLRGPALLVLVFFAGCASPLLPSPPGAKDFAQPQEEIPPSTLDIAVAIGLGRITEEAEKAVPRTRDVSPYSVPMDGGADQSGGVDLGYHVERSPLTLRMENGALQTGFLIGYWIKAEYRPLGPPAPKINLSCGTDGEPLRKATVTLTTRVDVNPNWTTTVKTTVAVRPETPCLVSLFKKDLTAKVMGELEGSLQKLAEDLDGRISREIRLRERLLQVWDLLEEPLFLDQGVWLSIHPQGVSISPLTLEGDVLSGHVRLVARPAVTGGPRPSRDHLDLPDLAKSMAGAPGFHVLLPVEMSYQDAKAFITRTLKIDEGQVRFPARGSPYITIRKIDLSSSGGRAVIRIDFDGSAEGCAYLVATPRYEPETHLLSFADVDFSLETKNLVLRSLEWLDHEALRSAVERALRIDLSKPLANIEHSLTELLHKKGDVFQLTGEFREFRLSGFHADPLRGTFTTLLLATGTLEAIVP